MVGKKLIKIFEKHLNIFETAKLGWEVSSWENL